VKVPRARQILLQLKRDRPVNVEIDSLDLVLVEGVSILALESLGTLHDVPALQVHPFRRA